MKGKALVVDLWTGPKPATAKGKGTPKGATQGDQGVWMPTEMYNMLMSKGGAAFTGKGAMPMGRGGCCKGGRGNPYVGGGVSLGKGKAGSHDPSFKVHVTNMADGMQWQELKDHMRQAGTVEFCAMKDGIGEVRYSNAEEAQTAVELLNGSEVMGTLITVSAFV